MREQYTPGGSKMDKEKLRIIRIVAIALSLMLGSLTLCNLFTVMTHGIEVEIPDETQYTWAIDPVAMKLIIMSEFTVKNHGAYDIDDIDIRAKIITDQGKELLNFEEKDLAISRGTDRKFDILLEISLNDIEIENWLTLLYRDTTMSLVIDIDAEYMFGLIHLTVDETIDRHWTAPLSGYSPDYDIIPWVLGAFGFNYIEIDQAVWEVQRSAVEYLMEVDYFNYTSEDGYDIKVTGQDFGEDLRMMDCAITVPAEILSGNIQLGYNMIFGIVENQVFVNVQEVNVSYVAD